MMKHVQKDGTHVSREGHLIEYKVTERRARGAWIKFLRQAALRSSKLKRIRACMQFKWFIQINLV